PCRTELPHAPYGPWAFRCGAATPFHHERGRADTHVACYTKKLQLDAESVMNASFLRPLASRTALRLAMLGAAGAAPYSTLHSDASRVSFGYTQMVVRMKGGFSDIQATQFNFDPANPDAAHVAIEIPLSSIDAGYADANDE